MTRPRPRSGHIFARPAGLLAAAALATAALLLQPVVRDARADERCGLDLQTNVCLEANPLCPGTLTPLGPNP